jgi:predicted TIM-barrel fold metal-dependent hydrolase
MAGLYTKKIDAYTHILPVKYKEALEKILTPGSYIYQHYLRDVPTMYDVRQRLKMMGEFDDLMNILTPSAPALDLIATPKQEVELAKLANDGAAELVAKHPDRFLCAVASLPMIDVDAAIKEAERAIEKLHFGGIFVFSNVAGKPLSEPEFKPLWKLMAKYDLPIWMHPRNPPQWENVPFHDRGSLSWPFQTTICTAQMVNSGIFDENPNIKIIVHHCGGMLPTFYRRAGAPVDVLKKFYGDTAQLLNSTALMMGYQFFGADHMVFGTDVPFGPGMGETYTRSTIEAIEHMAIPDFEKVKIFEGNILKLMHMSIPGKLAD